MRFLRSWNGLLLVLVLVSNSAQASVSLLDSNWKIQLGGFVEVDSITDSTRSFNEKIGNGPVSRNVQNGQTGRDMMSIRNSRLSFNVEAPETEGWKTRGYVETDFLGYDPANSTVPTSSNGDTEASFFQNPTLRVRHAYIDAQKDGWDFLAGQTWMVLGWQPYYFIPTVQIQPVPGMLYNRTPQFRAVKAMDVGNDSHVQAALGVMRPPQRDSGLPGFEGGLRLAYDGWSGGFVGGSTPPEKVQPLSIAVSGAIREFSAPSNLTSPTGDQTHYTGHALAVDALIPVIPSADGKDPSNTLTIGGEFTSGKGDGDEFDSWTGGMLNPINATGGAAGNTNVALDAGVGGVDATGGFNLIDVQTFNLYAQYHLPSSWKAWISLGYGQLFSDNIVNFQGQTSGTSGYNKEQVGFANIMKDMTSQIRLGFEFAQIATTFTDGTLTHDNRYQLSAFFIF